ncbi:hypothetical protein RvY_16813-1 [Ramazzottius varieornatus]|uniref:Uncharacterized protein n=1 Tax=Ramazzottius varieornatus TaxID=947166 RepID=A0A1D1VZU5_RAMVA|nr:hypothetical protein RvY_16813-1 [Ramazzottius varieornatus]
MVSAAAVSKSAGSAWPYLPEVSSPKPSPFMPKLPAIAPPVSPQVLPPVPTVSYPQPRHVAGLPFPVRRAAPYAYLSALRAHPARQFATPHYVATVVKKTAAEGSFEKTVVSKSLS